MGFLSQRLNKPEYLFRPQQILKRLTYFMSPPQAGLEATIRLPWALSIRANPRNTIGKSLSTLGVYEIAVSEAIWRLTEPGDACADVGANIGYMTSIMAVRSGSAGLVKSFEPHPKIFTKLQSNTTNWTHLEIANKFARVEACPFALGNRHASMRLTEPEGHSANDGIASLGAEGKSGHQVQVQRLDSLPIPSSGYGVVKVDVEGTELEVFEGGEALLAAKKIRDIIYEDFSLPPSRCAGLLRHYGYAIFRLAKQLRGPRISDPKDRAVVSSAVAWEPPNYLATIQPERVQERMSARGWKCLRG